ncbi:MAG: hypothetical protein ACD_48C00601G0002 [uncultured bacterium]|nr:MAG: hypothetical protein ACD_48C00601G0002 [uncultured bacterium]
MDTQQMTSIGWMAIKILTIVGLSLYAIYGAIIIRQEELMSKVLAETSEPILRLLSIVHLIASLAVIVLAIILL